MAIASMRKRMPRRGAVCLLLCLLLHSLCAPVRAAETGQALYTARFDEYTSLRDAGVYFGTSSGSGSSMILEEEELRIVASGGEKTYLLLPDVTADADTYVIEFSFRFTEIAASNGYLGFLLSSSGDAPSSRTELIIRAAGTVDGYTGESEAQRDAALSGEEITVRILVYYGYMMDFRLLVAGKEIVSSAPSNLVQVNPAGWGFVLRNASVALDSVRAVSGNYDDLSKAENAPNYVAPADWQTPETVSPPTGDGMWLYAAIALASAAGVKKMRRR